MKISSSRSGAHRHRAVLWPLAALCFVSLLCLAAPVGATPDAAGPNATNAADAGKGPREERPSEPQPAQPGDQPADEAPPAPAFHAGLDFYGGLSNLEGQRRFRDGFWAAGAGLAYPSNIYLRWTFRRGAQAKVAIGTGKLYTSSQSTVDQPLEAWYQKSFGKLTATVGKYYVPFALQEWEYETKPGLMLQTERGPYGLALSANYNDNTRAGNAYLRASRSFGENATVGVSLGAGRGLSYDSVHDRGLAFDATVTRRGWQLLSEYMILKRRSSQRFRFGFARLSYENLGRLKPFIARYSWNDASGAFGVFRSTSAGLGYQLTPNLIIEGGYADTSDKDIVWGQLHWTWESRNLK